MRSLAGYKRPEVLQGRTQSLVGARMLTQGQNALEHRLQIDLAFVLLARPLQELDQALGAEVPQSRVIRGHDAVLRREGKPFTSSIILARVSVSTILGLAHF